MNYNEQIIQFSNRRGLIGIVSIPGRHDNHLKKSAVLILNAGLVHRVGPYRMHTMLARRLAEMGHLVFRFDLSNIGDSQNSNADLPYREQTIQDVKAAMDVLSQNYDASSFVSIGLCSGAMNTHFAAVADDRICGAIMLDAYGYKTGKYLLRHFAPRMTKIFTPMKLFGSLGIKSKQDESQGIEGIDFLDFPPRTEVARDLKRMIDRSVRLLFIYTGGVSFYYNYDKQLLDNFPFLKTTGLVELHYLQHVDHTFTLLEDRDRLFELIIHWLD